MIMNAGGGQRKFSRKELHSYPRWDNRKQNGYRIAQRDFLSHAEFPDVNSACRANDKTRTDTTFSENVQPQRCSTNKVGKFKPFDPYTAPANFKKGNNNASSQNIQQCNQVPMNGQQFCNTQGQTIYQYIPPQEFSQTPQQAMNIYAPNMPVAMVHTGASATAVAPNGQKIYIPLDDDRYEIRRGDHDLYDMPQDCDLYPSSEGAFESSVQIHSPRPVDIRGSLSDEWSGSSLDGPDSETESEHETTEQEIETDASEMANNLVANFLKSIGLTTGVENLAASKNEDTTTAGDGVENLTVSCNKDKTITGTIEENSAIPNNENTTTSDAIVENLAVPSSEDTTSTEAAAENLDVITNADAGVENLAVMSNKDKTNTETGAKNLAFQSNKDTNITGAYTENLPVMSNEAGVEIMPVIRNEDTTVTDACGEKLAVPSQEDKFNAEPGVKNLVVMVNEDTTIAQDGVEILAVEHLVVQNKEDATNVDVFTAKETTSQKQTQNDSITHKSLCEKSLQEAEYKQPASQTRTISKANESSSSEADDPKRTRFDNDTRGIGYKGSDGIKENKKPKIKKSRAWKENRKDKHKSSKPKNKQAETASESKPEADEGRLNAGNTENKCVSNSPATEVQDNVVIDGQGYFKTLQLENGQYQHYYTPDTYTFVPNQYQRCQFSAAPEYTMFIHDACPPPAQDEVFDQVHKSLSGELINNHATYQSQAFYEANDQQQQCATFQATNNAEHVSNQQVHSYPEDAVCPTYPDYCSPSSQYAWTPYETQPVFNQYSLNTVSDQPEQHSGGQGQIYISYDEDSVYVDPESGLSYPALHTTDDNLITVILREGVFLEITVNKALRLVNHEKKLVVAIDETGNKACVIHPATRIYQSGSNVHAELYLGRRAKMTEELVIFGNKLKTYKFDNRMITEMSEEPVFRDLSHDESVTFLSTDSVVGIDETKLKIQEILAHAHFWKNGLCGSTVIINGTKVVQNEKGDVTVCSGPINFLRMNPDKMILRLKTKSVEIDIETNWNVKITRGSHALNASHMGFIVCNGKIKACLDTNNRLQSFSMPDHRFLMLGQPISKHRPGVPGGNARHASDRKPEPEGDHWGYTRRGTVADYNRFRDWEEGWDYEFDNQDYRRRWDPRTGRWVHLPRRNWRDVY